MLKLQVLKVQGHHICKSSESYTVLLHKPVMLITLGTSKEEQTAHDHYWSEV